MCSCAAGSSASRSAAVPAIHADRSNPWNRAATDLVLLQHHRDRFRLVERGLPRAAALGVGRERALELVGEAQIVDDEAARLVPEHPVDAGDRLHQPVATHGLVDIEAVQARCVEAGEPHVAHQHDAEGIACVAEALRQFFSPGLVADVLLPVRRVGGSARHHHLEAALVVVLVVPLGAQAGERTVEVNADATAHADDHRLAVHGLEARLEVFDDVARDQRQPLLRPDDRLQLRPLGLELLLARDLLALSCLLEAGVDLRPLRLVQRELGETAFVVDRHRRTILDRALDVVDADIVAEHGAGVGVVAFDRRAGEADEGRIGQGVVHVAREAVDEVVLAAVRLVGDHHDVAPLREQRVPVAFLLGEEFLDCGEDHAAGLHRELRAQIGPVLRLDGGLTQQVGAAREGGEELVVEVVAIGQHHHGGVGHRRLADDTPGVERHGEALARALRVPNDTDATVTGRAARPAAGLVAAALFPGDDCSRPLQLGRAQGFGHGGADRVELVIAGHLLGERAAAVVLEDDEVADEREEPRRRAGAFQHHLQFRHRRWSGRLARDRAPRLEPLPPGGERADARLDPVGDDERRVHGKERRQLGLVGLELLPGGPDGGLFRCRVLELDQPERQPVDEQHHVGAPLVLVLDHGNLIDREPVAGARIVEVQDTHLCAPDMPAVRSGAPRSRRPRPCGERHGCGPPPSPLPAA